MKTLFRLACFVPLLALALGRVAAATSPAANEYGQLAASVIVPDGLAAADVQQAILLAGSGRGWAVKERADGKVVLFLEQGRWRSTLTLIYTKSEVTIYSDSGKPDKTGVIKKQEIPDWVKYLKQDITKHLGQKAFAK